MKTRTGFVSNSSSSSFIVFLNHKPNDYKELKEMLFNPTEEYIELYESTASTEDIAKKIFDYIKDKKDLKEILKIEKVHDMVLKCREIYENDGYNYRNDEYENKLYAMGLTDNIKNKLKEMGYSCLDDVIEVFAKTDLNNINLEGFVFQIEYYDDEEFEAICEHGGIFDRVPHTRISHH